MTPLVEVQGVSKVYYRDSQALPVLQALDLTIGKCEFLALMGPSGSGKTTLLNLLAGLDIASEGSIRVSGEEITRLKPKQLAAWRARHVGFIFQLYNLIPVLTALQNVELPLLLTPLKKKERREHAETALRIVGLEERLQHFPRQLSGGQEQRVGIARAIVTDPTLILADEPTGDLDAKSAAEILDLLSRLNTEFGKTIVMVTHDPHAAERAGRTLHLEKGALLEQRVHDGRAAALATAVAGVREEAAPARAPGGAP
ncbi:MAG: ABC transporter ATP-binding protein [Longimicrobiales bacterium]